MGKETLHTPGDGKLKSAIYAVFGKEFTAGLMPVEYDYNGIEVSGFVSKPANARPNRSMQHFFSEWPLCEEQDGDGSFGGGF